MSGSGAHHLKDEGSKTQVVVAGATAGLVARFVIAPLDVVKIRLQLQSHLPTSPYPPLYRGAFSTLLRIRREEGLPALWKGNIPAEALYITYSALQFTTYRLTTVFLQRLSPQLPQSAESFIAGAAAGALSTTLTYPLDLLRTRFAAQGTQRVYASLAASLRTIARDEGPAGFFRGLSAAIVQIVPYMGIFFAIYETLHPLTASVSLPFGSADAVVGTLASVMAKSAVFPLDLVRKRLQVQGPTRALYVHRDIPMYKGVARTVAQVLRTEGPRGLYRGLGVSLVKAAPASAVTMWTYERALKVLRDMEERKEAAKQEP